MQFLKSLRTKAYIAFRKFYEKRLSLPYGIGKFIGNVAFIQLDRGEYVELAPYLGVGQITLTTQGMRPMLTYEVWPDGGECFRFVQVIIEQRGFQLRLESPLSIESRQAVQKANSIANKAEDLKPVPPPEYEADWHSADIREPHISPLTDLFLGFSFYQPLMKQHKKVVAA